MGTKGSDTIKDVLQVIWFESIQVGYLVRQFKLDLLIVTNVNKCHLQWTISMSGCKYIICPQYTGIVMLISSVGDRVKRTLNKEETTGNATGRLSNKETNYAAILFTTFSNDKHAHKR